MKNFEDFTRLIKLLYFRRGDCPMKLFARFVSCKLYPFFVVIFLLAVCMFWKSAPKVESAITDNKISEIENYDIRTQKSDEAQKNLEKFIRESGKDSSLISAERKNVRRTVEELKTNKRWKIEYNEDLRTPEIIAAEIGKDANLLTASSVEKRDKILRRFLRENSALFGLDETQIDRTRNDRRLHESERRFVIRSSRAKDQWRSRFSRRSQSRIYKTRRNVSRHQQSRACSRLSKSETRISETQTRQLSMRQKVLI